MTFVSLLPVFSSVLLLAAHFLRAGHVGLMTVCLAAPFVLLLRHRVAARAMQAFLLLAALEWLRTAAHVIRVRAALGEPWLRFTLILGAVVAVTLASALVFETRRLQARYPAGPGTGGRPR